MDDWSVGFRLSIIFILLAINAFFAGSEVALISSSRARLQTKAEGGNVGAQAALSLLSNPERLLSVIQVGVTLASLGLGWAGESSFQCAAMWLFGPLITPATQGVIQGISFAAAFLVLAFMHVVIGEVVPKNLAIEETERLAILTAPPLLAFYRISLPFVYAVEKTSIAVSRLLGLEGEPHGGGHSAEELRLLVRSSRLAGGVNTFEEAAIQHVLELSEFRAREAMVPRNDIVSISVGASLDEALRVFNEHRYSRYPVFDGAPENIVGIVLAKDLLKEWGDRRRATEMRRPVPPFDLRRYLRDPLIVPESTPLSQLMEDFRKSHIHMAIVVDEFGTVSGIITLEDVLEQVFGEIEDEYDLQQPAADVRGDSMELSGSAGIRDLEAQYGIELPGDAGFETLAGFVLDRLGAVPSGGEWFDYEGWRFTVLEMDRNRIAKVRVERSPEAQQPGN